MSHLNFSRSVILSTKRSLFQEGVHPIIAQNFKKKTIQSFPSNKNIYSYFQQRSISNIYNQGSPDKREERRKVCMIVGAGAGIGEALTRRFTKEGYITVVARRDAHALKQNVEKLESELLKENQSFEKHPKTNSLIMPYPCDPREERQVVKLFKEVENEIGEVSVCIFNVGANISFPLVETSSQKFYKCWEMACYSGFLVGREAAKFMIQRGSGNIIFTGATASTRGAANFAAFSVAKSGLRALSQSMARELGPKGVHVSHVIIDGAVDSPWIRQNFSEAIDKLPEDGLSSPDHIADAYWHLTCQHKSAWTHEMDLRPYCERF